MITRAVTLFDRHRGLRVVALCGLLLAAFAVRVYNLEAPGILPEREFRAMTIARVSYFEHAPSIPTWRREIALLQEEDLWTLEPPIMELAVAKIYQAIGTEDVSVARVLNSVLWVCGGVFMFGIAGRVMPPAAALAATAYYLFVPLGVLVSRSFQPDSLMILLYLMSLFALLVFSDRQTWSRLVAAACLSSLTLLVRPLPVCAIFGAFIAVYATPDWRRLFDAKGRTFVIVTLVPAALYYGYGLLGRDDLRYAEMSFRPHLLLHREYWEGWLVTATSAVGPTTLVAGLVGLALLGPGVPRRFLAALCLGYVVFGLLFTHHIHTHNYYHLQLVVITALALGLLLSWALAAAKQQFDTWYGAVAIALALIVVTFFAMRDVRSGLRAPRFESRETAREIGAIVHHSRRVVHVSRHYGQPLEYFGELSGAPWPKALEYWLYQRPGERALTLRERLHGLGFVPEYFVITDFDSFQSRHADLKQFLETKCGRVLSTDQYSIYDGACARDAD